MGTALGPNKITGATFKKMLMDAHGHHTMMPLELKKAMTDLHAQKYLYDKATVQKDQAVKIVKALKEKGLTHRITTTATDYVHSKFRQEEQVHENIKKQNLAEHAKEIATEKAKEVTQSSKPTHTPAATRPIVPLQATPASIQPHSPNAPKLTSFDKFLHHTSPNTTSPTSIKTIKPSSEEAIDLAID
ncbi:MAG: hypothetical protein WCV88_04355 [Patescibacteria group bacterium]